MQPGLQGWDELLRVAGSLKMGYVTALLLISKLQEYPRQNRLTRLLREHGRLAETIHALCYLESEAYRRPIGRQFWSFNLRRLEPKSMIMRKMSVNG